MIKDRVSPSQPVHKVKEVRGLACPMRDGVELVTDLYMPDEEGAFPTVLIRTPYDKHSINMVMLDVLYLAQRGFAVAVQDVRGRHESPGEWYPFVNEASDGHDAVEWVAAQPWSNGKVGSVGSSYLGLTQWQMAQGGSPHMVASVPRVAYSNAYHHWVYTGGAFQLAFNLSWTLITASRVNRWTSLQLPQEIHIGKRFWHLPLITADDAAGGSIPRWKDWVNHPSYDDYWRSMSPVDERYAEMQVSALSMEGWYDVFLQGSLNNFIGMTAGAKTEKARRGQKIIVGPWIHGLGGNALQGLPLGSRTKTGDVDFGVNAQIDLRAEQVRWLDYWLKGIDNGIVDEPRVKVFVMGVNRWREADDWPLPETQYTPYYLHSGGGANSLLGDGGLGTTTPESESPDRYVYDPEHPVMTIGGNTCCNEEGIPVSMGPHDQRPNEYRPDVLVYSTGELERDVEVTGPVKVVLYASSSARDTDFTAKLVDVHPDGYARNVAQGIIRARYRDSWEEPSLLDPGRVYEYTIDLWSTSNCFQRGHQIRVEVSSSDFPQFDRNPNTGHAFGQDAEMQKADQVVYHDAEHASHILLPIIPQ